MRKLWYLTKESLRLMRRHKVWIISPLVVLLLLLTLLAFYVGPATIISFIYAGI